MASPRRCRPVTGWMVAATWYSSSTLSPEISFVVPARNEGEHLARTVGEIRRTMPPASEIIVVDDGSIDGSADAVACTARDDLRLVRAEGLAPQAPAITGLGWPKAIFWSFSMPI